MSNNSVIQDIGSLLETNINFEQDIKEIIETVKVMVQKKYIDKIYTFVQDNREQVSQNPTEEIALLQAVKPFMNSSSYPQIDMFIEAVNTMRMFQNLQKQVKSIQLQRTEQGGEKTLIQEDGVYEIDEACMMTKDQSQVVGTGGIGIFLLLILLFSNR